LREASSPGNLLGVKALRNRRSICDVEASMKLRLATLFVAGFLCGCGPATTSQPDEAGSSQDETAQPDGLAPTTSQPAAPLTNVASELSSEQTEIDIVATASLARLTTDNSFGGAPVFDRVNIVDRYGTPTPDGFLQFGPDSSLIEPEVRAAVEQALKPMSVTWVGSSSEVIGTGQEIPSYQDVGPVLTLGTPNVDGDQAEITTGLWCGDLCGAGGNYGLEWTESEGWLITGMEGPQWIS
jgi:hypothetical protein